MTSGCKLQLEYIALNPIRVNKGETALHLSGRGIYKALDDCRNLTPCVRQIRKYGVALPINVSSSNTYSCTFIPDKEIQCNTTY